MITEKSATHDLEFSRDEPDDNCSMEDVLYIDVKLFGTPLKF